MAFKSNFKLRKINYYQLASLTLESIVNKLGNQALHPFSEKSSILKQFSFVIHVGEAMLETTLISHIIYRAHLCQGHF